MQPSTLHHFRQSCICLALPTAGLLALGWAQTASGTVRSAGGLISTATGGSSNASQDLNTATGACSTASEANNTTTSSGSHAYGDYSVANCVYPQAGTIQIHLSAFQACAQGFLPVWTDKTSLQCLKELP